MQISVLGILALVYGGFWRWYTGTQKPLTADEVAAHLARLEAAGANPQRLEQMRTLLTTDTGHSFVMVNLLKLADAPTPPPGADDTPQTARTMLNRYSAQFLSALFRRAGHPILVGTPASEAVEAWGLEGATEWSQVALVRYRSRRDMMAAVADPRFADSHPYKIAALEKTIAVPLDPWMHLGDPRLIVGLCLIIVALLVRRRG